jgi:hypothetical protein
MIRTAGLLLVPAGDHAPAGRRVEPDAGRLVLGLEGRCWVAAAGAELIETDGCGLYLRLDGPTALEGVDEELAELPQGVYQVIRPPD